MKVNAGKSKGMVLSGEEELECGVYLGGIRLEHVSEFKYMGCVLDESGTDEAKCTRNLASGRRVTNAIRFLVNATDLQIEWTRVLHETLLVPVLMYGIETMLWKKERFRIRVLQIYNLRSFLGVRRMDRVPNARIRELCGEAKGIDERVDKGFLGWFDHVE